MASNMVQKVSGNRYFWRHFSKVYFFIHFGRPLSHFGCPLAHLWFPFGSPWLPFGSLWLTFGSLWLPFGSLWLPFGSLLVPFGSLLLTRAVHFITFAVSWPLFRYFSIFTWKIPCKIIFLKNSHRKSHSQSIKSYFPEECRTHPNRKYILSCNPSSRARGGTFASGNLD